MNIFFRNVISGNFIITRIKKKNILIIKTRIYSFILIICSVKYHDLTKDFI